MVQARSRAVGRPDDGGFALDTSLGFIVQKAAVCMRRAFEAELEPYGVTAPQWSLLARIAEQEGSTQAALGESSLFDRATTTGILARLEARGVVERRPHADDPRANAVFLTPAGRRLFAQLPALAERVNARALHGMTRADAQRLRELLGALIGNFDG